MRCRTGARLADGQWPLEEILGRLYRRGRVGDTDGGFGCRRTEPGHSPRIEARALGAVERPEDGGPRDEADDRAVLGGEIVDVIRGDETAGSGHVLGDDRRTAGQMLADM